METTYTIHGRKVKLVFNFDEYSKRLYRNDFEDFLEYQTKREEFLQPRDTDLKFLNIKELKNIPYKGLAQYLETRYPYDFFQKTVLSFLTRVVYQTLTEFPKIITSEDFEVQIKISRITQRAYYGGYDEEISDVEHAYTEFSGLWLLNTIVMPWAHYKRIDYPVVYNFLLHELTHHIDNIHGKFVYEQKLNSKWKMKAKKISNYSLIFLISAMLELRIEGFADFAKKRNFPRFDIDISKIREFKRNLTKLISIRQKEAAEEFFTKKLSLESYLTYYCGSLMCYFIALSLAKQSLNEPIIVLGSEKFPLEYLNKLMNKGKRFFIQNLPTSVFDSAYEMISSMGPVKFLHTYAYACNHLGISKKNRVLWRQLFAEYMKAAEKVYEKERIKKIMKKGYKP